MQLNKFVSEYLKYFHRASNDGNYASVSYKDHATFKTRRDTM